MNYSLQEYYKKNIFFVILITYTVFKEMPKTIKQRQLSNGQKTRLENYTRPIVSTVSKIPQRELDRRERERLCKESKMTQLLK
jgi:hypothetical protein